MEQQPQFKPRHTKKKVPRGLGKFALNMLSQLYMFHSCALSFTLSLSPVGMDRKMPRYCRMWSNVVRAPPRHTKKKVPRGLGKFNYIRLLSPATRSNRWMHTTWHHLPEYKEHRVENWSSHYIRPHAAVPRHFSIHPDWG
jgi:hypothetical protein